MVNIDKIKALARAKGLKLGKLCEDLGEDVNYFNKVKAGLRRMDDGKISYLADRLGTTFAYLTDCSDSPLPVVSDAPFFDYRRYEERRIARSLTKNYVERFIGIPSHSMEEVEDGSRELTDEEVTRLAIVLDTTYDYLMGLTDNPQVPLDDHAGVKIKVFGEVAAGIPIQQIDNFDPDDADSWEEIDRRTAKSGTYFALRIKGDSMEPRIYNGDVVIVRVQCCVNSGDIAVVAVSRDTATCKKVMYDQSGGMFLMSLNPNYAPMYFTPEQVHTLPVTILGKVVELRGKI